MTDTKHSLVTKAGPLGSIEPLALPIEATPAATGVTRTRIFQAVADKELTARKAGKATIIELAELRRWINSLPSRGRKPETPSAA